MSKREKVLLIIIIAGLLLLTYKSLVIDELSGLNKQQQEVVNEVDRLLDKEYDNFLYDSILNIKVVEIEKVEGTYYCKVRKYLFRVLPIYQYKMRIDYEGENK